MRKLILIGRSEAGKSTLIQALRNEDIQYHKTQSVDYTGSIIDTPGVREIEVPFEDITLVKESFPELKDAVCQYPGCLHHGEQGCIVPDLVEKGVIDEGRYDSYLRILSSLEERKPFFMRNKK